MLLNRYYYNNWWCISWKKDLIRSCLIELGYKSENFWENNDETERSIIIWDIKNKYIFSLPGNLYQHMFVF